EKTESSPMLADHGLRSHEEHRLSPIRPEPREPDPKPAISPSQPWSWASSFHHGQLLTEGKILQSQLLDTRRANKQTKDRKEQSEHANEYRRALRESQFIFRQMQFCRATGSLNVYCICASCGGWKLQPTQFTS